MRPHDTDWLRLYTTAEVMAVHEEDTVAIVELLAEFPSHGLVEMVIRVLEALHCRYRYRDGIVVGDRYYLINPNILVEVVRVGSRRPVVVKVQG